MMNRNLMLLGLFSMGALSAIQADEPATPEVAVIQETPATTTTSETTPAEDAKTTKDKTSSEIHH